MLWSNSGPASYVDQPPAPLCQKTGRCSPVPGSLRHPTAHTSSRALPAIDVTVVLLPPGLASAVRLHDLPPQTCTHGVFCLPLVVVPAAYATLPNAATSLTLTP